MILGGGYPRPGQFRLTRVQKVSSGNVKFTIDFGGAMILGDGEVSTPEFSFSIWGLESIIGEYKIYNRFWNVMIWMERRRNPRGIGR